MLVEMNEGVDEVRAEEWVHVGNSVASCPGTVLGPAGEVTHSFVLVRIRGCKQLFFFLSRREHSCGVYGGQGAKKLTDRAGGGEAQMEKREQNFKCQRSPF